MYSQFLLFIRSLERSFLRLGISLQLERIRKSDYEMIIRFLRTNRPILTDKPLIRLGDSKDGGYLLPDDFNGVSYCLSPGVSDNASFEQSLFQNYGIRSHLCDYSVDRPPIECEGFSFTKKFLSSYDSRQFTTLKSWMDQVPIDNNMILQMDIEGYEYEVLTHKY